MDLTALKFTTETGELDLAITKINELAQTVRHFNQAQKDQTAADKAAAAASKAKVKALEDERASVVAQIKAVEDAQKAAKKTADAEEASNEAKKESISLLEKLTNKLNDMSAGFTAGESAVLNQARALGAVTQDGLKPYIHLLTQIKELSKNPFDASLGAIRSITAEYDRLTERANLAARGISLTTKQLSEYSRIAIETKNVVRQMGEQMGFDPSSTRGLEEYNKLLTESQADYLMVATAVNKVAVEEKTRNDAQLRADKLMAEQQRANLTMMDQAVKQFRDNQEAEARAAEQKAQRIINANQGVADSIQRINAIAGLVKGGMSEQEATKRYDLKSAGVEAAQIEALIVAQNSLNTVRAQATVGTKAQAKGARDVALAEKQLADEDARMLSILSSLNTEQDHGVGINEKAARSIATYEARLKRAGVAQEEATRRLALYKKQQVEVMQIEQKRQIEYLKRGLQPQIGDVVVSLAAGQNPLTVMLQQGDQIRGLIAQTGVEGVALQKAMKDALAGTLVSIKQTGGAMLQVLGGAMTTVASIALGPLTKSLALGSAAMEALGGNTDALNKKLKELGISLISFAKMGVIGLILALTAMSVAMYQAMAQSTELNKAIVLQGASLGLTGEAAYKYAESMSGIGATTTKAVAVISEMAKVGGLGRDSIAMITEAAIGLEKYGGVAIADTVKQFGKLREKPVEALTELAIATGLINPEIIKQVKSLKDQGREADAAALAMKAYGDASKIAINSLKGDLSPLELAWKSIGSAITDAWDKFKNFVNNSPTLVAEFKTIADEISAPFRLMGWVFDKMTKTQGQRDQENLGGHLAGLPTGPKPSSEETQRNAELVRAQDRVMQLEDKYASNKTSDGRAKAIGEIRDATISYYRAAMQGSTDLQIAQAAELKIAKMIANMDYKAPSTAENHRSASFDAPNSNEAANIQKQYVSHLKALKAMGEDARKTNKSNYDAGIADREEYVSKDIALLKSSEQAQLAAVKQYEIDSSKAYTDSILEAVKNRDAALAKASGSKDPAADRAKIYKDYAAYVTNLGNNFETLTLQVQDAKDALASSITQKEIDAINMYSKSVKDNLDASEKWQKTQADFVINRQEERDLQDEINNASGYEVDVLIAKAAEQKRWTQEITRTREELLKSQRAFEIVLNNPEATNAQIEAAMKAMDANFKIHQDTITNSRVAVENEGTDAIIQYYKKEFQDISKTMEDVVTTFLFEGGKAGAKKLREAVIEQLKKPVVMVVQAIVNTVAGSIANNILGKPDKNSTSGSSGGVGGLSSLGNFFGGNSLGVGIGRGLVGVGNNLVGMGFDGIGSSISGFADSAAGVSNMAYGIAGIGGGLFGSLFGGQGSTGGSLGATAGMALSGGNPLMGALGAFAGSIIGSLFGGGTPYNTGGNYTANADGTGRRVSDRAELTALIPNLGKAGYQDFSKRGSSELDSATKDLATNMLGTLNPVLKEFGKDSVDFINVAFRANGKKATGNLNIGGTTTNFKTGENDPEKAFVQFGNFAADQIVETLKQAGLPQWAEDLLNEVPKNSGIEGLKVVLTTINQVQELTKLFNNLPMANLKTITTEATIELIKMAGGLDALTNSLSSYYNNFYSAEDKAAVQMQNLARDFKALGIDIVPKTRQAFVDLVNSQDLTTEAGREMYLELLNLQQGLSDVLPPLEDLSKTLEEVTNDAFAKLEEAVNAQKEYYSNLRDTAKESVSRLKGIFDLLATNIRELYDSVQETSGNSAVAGKAVIAKTISTGVLPDQEVLATAIKSVRDSFSSDNYATRFEAERDAMILAGQLSQIQKITGVELTAAEKQLQLAEDQLKALDNILANAKKQIDIARGIDTSIKSVAQAIQDLTNALTAETSGSSGSTSTTVDNGKFTVGGSGAGTSSALQLGKKTASGKFTMEQNLGQGWMVTEARADQQPRLEQLATLYSSLAGIGTVKDLLLKVKDAGYSLIELGAVSGYHYTDWLNVATANDIPRFATGGNHAGGLRIVGDGGGPELEATGPSRIFSAGQTKAMLNNDSLADEVRQLRAELRAIALDQATKANEQLKIQKRWDSDGLPDVRSVA